MQAGTALGNLAGVIGIRPEEAAVVEQLKAGSEDAFAWLIARYQQPLYSLIYRILPNPGDAADITQEVFVKVFRGIGHFHGEASLRTWIYRIALHEALNQRRWWSRHQRQQVTIEPENDDQYPSAGESLVDPHESPFDAAAHAEVAARVEAALRDVPEPFRTVVVLRDIEGFGYEEIAEILNANLGTVKSRLMRGRAHLKNLLAPYMEAASRKPSRPSSVNRACSARGGHMSSCSTVRAQFSNYLDGNLSGVAMQSVAAHLSLCGKCYSEFEQWRAMQQSLAKLGPARPPADLALRIRVALSQESSKTPQNALASWKVRWENTVAPFLLQASAGLASSLVLVTSMAFLIGAFAQPAPASATDAMASNPRFLYSTVEGNAGTVSGKGGPVTVEVYVDTQGRVYDYDIVSGPNDGATRAELETLLLSSKFEPAMWFGQPVRGVALLSFAGVSVQG